MIMVLNRSMVKGWTFLLVVLGIASLVSFVGIYSNTVDSLLGFNSEFIFGATIFLSSVCAIGASIRAGVKAFREDKMVSGGTVIDLTEELKSIIVKITTGELFVFTMWGIYGILVMAYGYSLIALLSATALYYALYFGLYKLYYKELISQIQLSLIGELIKNN